MDNIFFPDLNGPFNLEDIFPDDPWINNAEFPVQNLENIPESNVTAQEVLEETILSPADNLSGTKEELDYFFTEEFINLAAIESNMNSFNADPMAGLLTTDDVMPNVFGDFHYKEDLAHPNPCQMQSLSFDNKSESTTGNVIPEPIDDFDTTAVVPNVIPPSPLSVPDSPVDSTCDVFNPTIDVNQLDPALLALLENLERSVETNEEPNCRKRALVAKEEIGDEASSCKKKKPQSCSSTDEETVLDKVTERRVKNNAASRVCRASRKARHQELFQREKELKVENKELRSKVETLSATVEYLRKHLVNKLSARHK